MPTNEDVARYGQRFDFNLAALNEAIALGSTTPVRLGYLDLSFLATLLPESIAKDWTIYVEMTSMLRDTVTLLPVGLDLRARVTFGSGGAAHRYEKHIPVTGLSWHCVAAQLQVEVVVLPTQANGLPFPNPVERYPVGDEPAITVSVAPGRPSVSYDNSFALVSADPSWSLPIPFPRFMRRLKGGIGGTLGGLFTQSGPALVQYGIIDPLGAFLPFPSFRQFALTDGITYFGTDDFQLAAYFANAARVSFTPPAGWGAVFVGGLEFEVFT